MGNGAKNDRLRKTALYTSPPLELLWPNFQAVHCTGWNNCSWIKKLLWKNLHYNFRWNATTDRRWEDWFLTVTDRLNIVVYRYGDSLILKDINVDLKLTEHQSLLTKRVYLLLYFDILYKRCMVLDETTVHEWNNLDQEWMFLPNEPFPIVPEIKLVIGAH